MRSMLKLPFPSLGIAVVTSERVGLWDATIVESKLQLLLQHVFSQQNNDTIALLDRGQ